MEEKKEEKPRKIGAGLILGWVFGLLTIVAGATYLFSKPLVGIAFLLAGIAIFPPLLDFVKKKTNFELSWVLRLILFIVLIGIAGGASGAATNMQTQNTQSVPAVQESNKNNNSQPTATSEPKQWVTVIETSGSSDKRTDTFALQGGKTKLTYTFSGGSSIIGSIYVVQQGHSIEKEGGFPEVTATKAGTDSTFLTKDAGNYYLDIKSANTDWTIKIEEER